MNAVTQEVYAALQQAHYELLTLEPRLSQPYRENVRKVKERCKEALKAFEMNQPPKAETDLNKIADERAAEQRRAAGLLPEGTIGRILAMRVLQSDLYAKLDEEERAECDALIGKSLSGKVRP